MASMVIVAILAFTLRWVVGNKAGKEQVKDFMPGDHVWFYCKIAKGIGLGEIKQIWASTTKKAWYIEDKNGFRWTVDCECHLFRTEQEAEDYLKNMKDESTPKPKNDH